MSTFEHIDIEWDRIKSLGEVEVVMLKGEKGDGFLSEDVKQALLDCFAHVTWTDEYGQDYYDALYDALYHS